MFTKQEQRSWIKIDATQVQGCQVILPEIRNDFFKSRDLGEEFAQYLSSPFHTIFCLF